MRTYLGNPLLKAQLHILEPTAAADNDDDDDDGDDVDDDDDDDAISVFLRYSETNLKVRQALPCTADMIEIEQLSRFDGQ